MKIGIIKEGKIPRDTRVALPPSICAEIIKANPSITIVVEPCSYRCFSDQEYIDAGIELCSNMAECDLLLGIKEVPIEQLIEDKKYLFFSHTIKKQNHNKKLMKALLSKKITMIDYETLCDEKGNRVIAFGRWAGIVGAHNTINTYLQRIKQTMLPKMYQTKDFDTVIQSYSKLFLPPVKIILTGDGRVSGGALEVLEKMKIKQVSSDEFLNQSFDYPVFAQLSSEEMYIRNDGSEFNTDHFHKNPSEYNTLFEPYTKVANIMINGIYWDKNAPAFFSKEDMKNPDFTIETIGDITCDIAPSSSIPSTLYATTITEPVFGYNPDTEEEEKPFQLHVIDMMTIDNLPNELPRDASMSFGLALQQNVLPNLLIENSLMIDKATICKDGELTEYYNYLRDYIS
jgi:saccharopine dehydrogenase (NAD+, L-lysine forming)